MLNVITRINIAKGSDKIEIMKANPNMKHILEYAYNPFKKYYMKAPGLDGIAETDYNYASPLFQAATWHLLEDLHKRELSGQAAFEKVCDHISVMAEEDAEIFKRIINKDLRCGINVKSINKAFPGLIPLTFDGSEKPDIMLLKNFDEKKAKYPLMVAVKKDGVRARFVGGQLVSRQGHKINGCEHIEKELENFPYELDGELCIPGMIFDKASGKIRSNDPCPEAVYYVFDMPTAYAKRERYNFMLADITELDYVKIITHFDAHNISELLGIYEDAIEVGEEGIVIYDPDSLYEDKRSYDWTRLVPLKTSDCKVVGFFEGKGKHAGSLGGIIVDYKGHKVRVGTGFKEKAKKEGDKKTISLNNPNLLGSNYSNILEDSQNIRQYIWDNKEHFVGAIAESEFKEETKAGSMRQPRFKRWRWDKVDLTIHLCDNCMHIYPDCDADNIEFGNGFGNDNIYRCDCYLEI